LRVSRFLYGNEAYPFLHVRALGGPDVAA
jgi:hypothetical protein